jgi:tRNA(Ile)-lysidine synthetase-like protein
MVVLLAQRSFHDIKDSHIIFVSMSETISSDWFSHPEWWFSSDPATDKHISDTYGHLFGQPRDDPLENILRLDQLPRHLLRDQPASHVLCFYSLQATKIPIDLNKLDDTKFCFALLPWRHTSIFEHSLYAVEQAWRRMETAPSQQLSRFLKASYERFPSKAPSHVNTETYPRHILSYAPNSPPLPTQHKLPKLEGRIVISLSGGVDSMLASWLLKQSGCNLSALHINYNNRSTADDEAAFVSAWCKALNIPCYVRKIVEIRRPPCMEHGLRTTYETYTRNVRYAAYKSLEPSIVVLGHNYDDTLENMFTNIAHKTKYEDLAGMQEFGTTDSVLFWRPLLHMTKQQIIDMAHSHNIPYLPNSTPNWSMRGQIRSSVIPAIDRWHVGFVPGIAAMASSINELYGLVKISAERAIVSKNRLELGKQIPTQEIFWRIVFEILGIHISSKSLANMCQLLSKQKDSYNIVLTKKKTIRFYYDNGWVADIV